MNILDRAKVVFFDDKKPVRRCVFCEPIQEEILFETNHFRVLIDKYPLVPGHLLISTKEHYGAIGEIPVEFREEFLRVKEEVRTFARKISPSVIFYEHGKAGSCHASSSNEIICEHFHHHCLPVSACIHQEIAKNFIPKLLQNGLNFCEIAEKVGSYLYFENSLGVSKIYPARLDKVTPHYLRSLLCHYLQIDHLKKWQNYSSLDLYVESLKVIFKVLK